MDIGAYAQIDDLDDILKKNNIYVPRLRGLRLMSQEESLSNDEISKLAYDIGVQRCQDECQAHFVMDPWCFSLSSGTDRITHKYMLFDDPKDTFASGINWKAIHGYKRKVFKYNIKRAKKDVEHQYAVWNKYCGRSDVLYIHARIGGGNWIGYDGPKLLKEPWFLEKVDDAWDSTYCDIYAKIKEVRDVGDNR